MSTKTVPQNQPLYASRNILLTPKTFFHLNASDPITLDNISLILETIFFLNTLYLTTLTIMLEKAIP